MNFEKVEIYGFKSFADKAEIKFGDGITTVVNLPFYDEEITPAQIDAICGATIYSAEEVEL